MLRHKPRGWHGPPPRLARTFLSATPAAAGWRASERARHALQWSPFPCCLQPDQLSGMGNSRALPPSAGRDGQQAAAQAHLRAVRPCHAGSLHCAYQGSCAEPRGRVSAAPASSDRAARRARSLPFSLKARLRSMLSCLPRWEGGRVGEDEAASCEQLGPRGVADPGLQQPKAHKDASHGEPPLRSQAQPVRTQNPPSCPARPPPSSASAPERCGGGCACCWSWRNSLEQ